MKKFIVVAVCIASLLSCKSNSTPTDKVVEDLGNALNGWDKQAKPIEEGFYIKENIPTPTTFKYPALFEENIKGIIDRDLNATPTKTHIGWFFEGSIISDYEWDLPKLNVKLETEFKDKYTYKLWVKNK